MLSFSLFPFLCVKNSQLCIGSGHWSFPVGSTKPRVVPPPEDEADGVGGPPLGVHPQVQL